MALKNKTPMVLSFDDRKRFADFFRIFIAVDRRNKKKKRCKQKKSQKTKLTLDKIGSRIRGPSFFSTIPLSLRAIGIYYFASTISLSYVFTFSHNDFIMGQIFNFL